MNRSTPPAWDSPTHGALIREARQARCWSQDALARRIVRVRLARGETADAASVKTQISRWENDRITPDPLNLGTIAEAFDASVEALFGLQASPSLPRPVLLEAHVTRHTVDLLGAQRLVHSQTEHSLGPAIARELVAADLATVEGLLRVTPSSLITEMSAVAALIAELGGWVAQETGNTGEALTLTCRAHHYAQGAGDPAVEAMVLMRWANIVTPGDPQGALKLLERGASTAPERDASRLRAAISRQQAHAAAIIGDTERFDRYAARAAEHGQAPLDVDEMAPYADSAYVASETAHGLIVLGRPQDAAVLLSDRLPGWTAGQERDHAVALCRWLEALAASGDFTTALDQSEHVIAAYQRAPSIRAKDSLYAITTRHRDRKLPSVELRHRLADTLQGAREP